LVTERTHPTSAPTETEGLFSINAPVSTSAYLRSMWGRRALAMSMPMEQVRSKHQDTLLGNVWHLANPLLSVAVYFLVFGVFLNVSREIENYLLWLTVGVFAYGLTSRTIQNGATSIPANQGLMRSMRFPRALLPISSAFADLLTFGFQLIVLGVVAVATGAGLSKRLLLLPIILVVHSALNLGGSFIAARLNDSFKDVQQIIPFFFRLLMYLSGVMFPVRQYLENEGAYPLIRRAIELNPMVQILDLYRWAFLGSPVELFRLVELLIIVVAMLVFGFRFFRARELAYGRG
jgi:teichoic acid transport system permease protein